MQRQRLFFLLTVTTALALATVALLSFDVPLSAILGWTVAITTLSFAAWMFTMAVTARRDARFRRSRIDRLRARTELLLLVRELHAACGSAARFRLPGDVPAGTRWVYDRCCEGLLGAQLLAAAWDPLVHDLKMLRVAIVAAHRLQRVRPEVLRLVGSPFAFLQQQCEEVLERHLPSGPPRRSSRSTYAGVP